MTLPAPVESENGYAKKRGPFFSSGQRNQRRDYDKAEFSQARSSGASGHR